LQRRNGYHYELQPPEAAIPPEADPVSIDAAIALRTTFAKESPAVRALFDALVELLTGEGRRQWKFVRDRPQTVIPPRPAKQPLTGNGGPRLAIESSTLVRRSIVWSDLRQRGDSVIDRRSFVRLAVAGIALGSSVAHAQTGTAMRRVGMLSIGPTDTEAERREWTIPMRELGWIEGRNLAVERRFANLEVDLLRPYAEELVRLKVEVILTFGTEAAFAAKNATTSIPIVLASAGDPVGTGLVASLARPGGNITGYSIVSSEIEAKRAALIHELLPAAQRVAVVVDPSNRISASLRKRVDEAFRSLGVQPIFIEATSEQQLLDVPAEAVRQRAQALEMPVGITGASARRLMQSAIGYRLPS
jgi:putative ABC transport system substrate-binding protein